MLSPPPSLGGERESIPQGRKTFAPEIYIPINKTYITRMQPTTNRYFLFILLFFSLLHVISCAGTNHIPSVRIQGTTDPALPIHSTDEAFLLRGTKGYFWTPAQYLEEIPVLKNYGMNFLVTCYGSFFRDYAFKEGHNDWWIPMNIERKQEWQQVIRACQENGIKFCFGINPMLYSSRPLDTNRDEDFCRLLELYRWFQEQGVEWFYLALDDLHLHKGMRVDGKGQSLFVNKLYKALLRHDPSCKMIFCPTWYWGSSIKNPDKRAYLEEVAEFLHKDILTFWTGNDVVSPTVAVADAEAYREVIGHELVLWDNYPVNDFHNTLNIGPLTGRDPELHNAVFGIIANPMRDNRMNRLPLYTMADYMNDPIGYNPEESITRAIHTVAEDQFAEETLLRLVQYYPGGIIHGYTSTKYSVIRKKFEQLLDEDRSAAQRYVDELAQILVQLEKAFPEVYGDSKEVISNDLKWMNEQLSK